MNSDIRFYWALFKKRLPVMVAIFVLCAAVGVGLALTMPPKYRSSASLVVQGAMLPDELFTTTVQTAAAQQLQAIELKLMTRANLIDTATKFRVFRDASGMSPDDIVEAMQAATEFRLSAGRNEATILQISFESGNPQIAADVVNEFVTYVLDADARRRIGESGQTLEFYQRRVENLGRRLSEQSAEIVAHKEANSDALPDGLQFRLDRQAQLQERLNLNARDRTSLVEQRNRIVEAGSQAGLQGGLTPQQQEINQLEREIRSKLAFHAPDSATIQFLRERVRMLREDELPGDVTGEGDSVMSMLDLQLAAIDSEIRSIDQDTVNIEKELKTLHTAIERTPKVAIRLDELEREYQATQAQYNEALRARSTAEQGVDVEESAKGERVELVEPATVPDSPAAPNRKLIAGGGVFVGSALATAFFVLTELLNGAIRRPVDLTRGLGIQPLATIPYLEEGSVRRRRRILKVVFILFVLISIPVGLWAIHTYYLPLDLLLEELLERVGL